MRWRTDIDGLRGIAVLLVVAYHTGIPGVSAGFLGVDVFFVLSGYLITKLLMIEWVKTGAIDFIGFYARRLRRLIPAAILMLGVTSLAAWWIMPSLLLESTMKTAAAASIYISNMVLARITGDYFADNVDLYPFLHTWSLGVEEQFYLFWPILIWLLLRIAKGSKVAKFTLIILFTLLGFIGAVWLTGYRPNWAFYSMPSRAWEFGFGAIFALSAFKLPKRLVPLIGFAGIGLLAASSVVLGVYSSAWPGYWAMLPVVATSLALIAGEQSQDSLYSRVLSSRALRYLGKISYSWYLWHWPALVLFTLYFGNPSTQFDNITTMHRVLVVLVALLISDITHRLVENPIRFNKKLMASPSLTIISMIGLSIAGVVIFLLPVPKIIKDNMFYTAIREDRAQIYYDGCHLDTNESTLNDCVYGDLDAPKTMMLIGDSHAAQLFSAFEVVSKEIGVRLESHTKASCPVLGDFGQKHPVPFLDCELWSQAVRDHIIATKPDYVVLTASAGQKGSQEEMGHRLRLLISELLPHVGELYFIFDIPILEFDPLFCHAAYGPEGCSMHLSPIQAELEWQYDNVAGAHTIEITDFVCPEKKCGLFSSDGLFIWRDTNHLTNSFATTLSSELIPHFQNSLQPSFK